MFLDIFTARLNIVTHQKREHALGFDRVFDVNVKAIFLMTNACVPVMKKQKSGRIIVSQS